MGEVSKYARAFKISRVPREARKLLWQWNAQYQRDGNFWLLRCGSDKELTDKARSAMTIFLFRLRELGCEVKALK